MSTIGKVYIFGAAAVLLSACAGSELGKAEKVNAHGTAFDQHLYSEYVALSQNEYHEGDYKDSDVFALRATAAGTGRSPAPEMISARKVPTANAAELTAARTRLVSALNKGAADKAAEPTARAQAMYECWMQEQETPENFQPNDIAFCRNGFAEAMDKVEPAVMTAEVTPPTAAKPMAAAAPQPAAKPEPAFVVYFDFNSAELTPVAQKVVADTAEAAAASKASSVIVSGYADRSGPDDYNMSLSTRRAQAVAHALNMAGVKAKPDVSGYGEDYSHVSTPDGQREFRNRVVNIFLQK